MFIDFLWIFDVLGRPGPSSAVLGRLGPSQGRLEPSWAVLSRLGVMLQPSWAVLGPSFGRLGGVLRWSWPSWRPLEPVLGPLEPVLGRLGLQNLSSRRLQDGSFLDHFSDQILSRFWMDF